VRRDGHFRIPRRDLRPQMAHGDCSVRQSAMLGFRDDSTEGLASDHDDASDPMFGQETGGS
jgi:hypothetical protein